MKDTKTYIAPTKTAKLVDCHGCDGVGKTDEMIRVVSTNGLEQDVPQPCIKCNGSGKLWEDIQKVERQASVTGGQIIIACIGMTIISMSAIYVISLANFFYLLLWMMGATVMGWIIAALCQTKKEVFEEKTYTKTGQEIQVTHSLMQS